MKRTIALAAASAAWSLAGLAGDASDDFVRTARPVYAADPNCTTSVVERFSKSARDDDRRPGTVRWVAVRGARNVRDIGGWTGLKTGLVYRGSEVGMTEGRDGKRHGYEEYCGEGLRVFAGEMKLKTDFDLREKSEYGTNWPHSVIGGGVKALNRNVGNYVSLYSYGGARQFAEALREFANPGIYPTYIHCAGGADRTGTLCFVLETLCGVSLADATIDYELTSFSPVGRRLRNREADQPFAVMVRAMSGFPGKTFSDKVAYWAEKVAGLTKEEIAAIRANLTDVRPQP